MGFDGHQIYLDLDEQEADALLNAMVGGHCVTVNPTNRPLNARRLTINGARIAFVAENESDRSDA